METVIKCVCLVLALCCCFTVHVDGCGRGKRKEASTTAFPPTTPSFSPSNCNNSEKIDVHLTIQNKIQPEYFEYNVTLPYTTKNPLIRYLEQAADMDPHFKFTSTYYPGMGYFINSINGLAGIYDPDQTHWEILNSDLEQINLGVSSYMPNHEEWLIFNFTSGY